MFHVDFGQVFSQFFLFVDDGPESKVSLRNLETFTTSRVFTVKVSFEFFSKRFEKGNLKTWIAVKVFYVAESTLLFALKASLFLLSRAEVSNCSKIVDKKF